MEAFLKLIAEIGNAVFLDAQFGVVDYILFDTQPITLLVEWDSSGIFYEWQTIRIGFGGGFWGEAASSIKL